jgi:hypothetical protein
VVASRDVARAGRRRAGEVLVASLLLASVVGAGQQAVADGFISRKHALQRSNVDVESGDRTAEWRSCPTKNETYDLRNLTSTGNFGHDSNLVIGKDCAAAHTVTVGGTVTGTICRSLTWQEVKADYDATALRLEGKGWLASYDLTVTDLEDGFRPRVADGTEQNNTVSFLLSGAFMDWIRDDAIEDDYLMSGLIKDSLIDGTQRFVSARPTEGTNYTNHGMVVTIRKVLVRMKAMPNDRASDGVGQWGIFKWSEAAGTVVMSDSIVLLDEQPIDDEPFPPGSYSNVTLVLGPDFRGRYPTALPRGVRVTRKMRIWTKARRAWLATH